MSTTKELPDVRVGQVWVDNDPRQNLQRRLTVVHVPSLDVPNPGYVKVTVTSGARQTAVRLERFRPTKSGYRLLKDVE